ncbi:MAG: hypothetical protein K0S76_2886 [Herbinix sp.]|jgi:hypothetical protein|nr:hypothetical protein [Herbinix sp.]
MKQAEIQAGKVYVGGGTFNVMDTDFHNQASGSHITLGMSGRGNIIGNRFDGDPVIENKSFFESNIDHKEVVTEAVPEFMEYKPEIKVPAILQLFNVADETYGAVNDATITDNTQAIQKALDAAAQAGGGVVFLPPGKYRMDGSITIPKGVELRGTMDNSSVPHGEGSIFEVYAGENQPESDPFIIMEEGSGLRGITIDYPNQKYTGTQESEPDYKPVPYPYTIQGRGSDIYIINVGLRASYRGVDLYSYKCDNHYIDYLTGHVFNTGVRVGGNSANGKISNLQFNVIIYACGNESKFGSFPNSPIGVSNRPLYDYALQNLEFLVLGDCTGEILYNDFNYGSYKGLILRNDGNGGPDDGISMGLGLDGDTYTFYIEEGVTTDNFDFINTQVVSVGDSRTAYIYSEGNNSFDITLFASDYWGNPGNGIVFLENSGTLTLQTANFLHPGQDKFAVLKGGKLNIINSAINSTAHLVNNSEGGSKYISVQASVATPADIDLNTGEWINNIGSELPIATDGPIATAFDRNKWIGNASNNNGSTRSAFDSSINTRWDTGTAQAAGQWFSVDFGSKINFNCIIIDLGSSKGDAADAYHIYVSEDGSNWGEPVYSGEKLKGVIQIPNQNTRYLKIEQTGQVGSYWSIHEMYLYQYQE